MKNPFRSHPQGAESGPLLDRPATRLIRIEPGQGRIIEIVGVAGAGKTTQLRIWHSQQVGSQWYSVPEGAARWKAPTVAPLCFWDDAHLLPNVVLRKALRKAEQQRATVVIGTRKKLGRGAERQGLLTTTIPLPPITVPELRLWAASRIDLVLGGRTYAGAIEVPEPTLRRIAMTSAGSWHRAEQQLHVWAAQLAGGHQRAAS